jgi:hypothetical protein
MLKTSRKYAAVTFINSALLYKAAHSHVRKAPLISAIAFGLTLGIAGEALAAPSGVRITKIAETELASNEIRCPIGPPYLCFISFNGPPAISSDEVAFYSRSSRFADVRETLGIFTSLDGSISLIAATQRSLDYINEFDEPSLSDGTVAFKYQSSFYNHQSRHISSYRYLQVGSNGGLKTFYSSSLCEQSLPPESLPPDYPNSCENNVIGDPSVSEGVVAFNLNSSGVGSAGIYIYNNNVAGSLPVAVVTPDYPIPAGTGHFSNFGDPSLSGNLVAFVGTGSNSEKGIYTKDINTPGQPLSVAVAVDINTPIPGGTGYFADFGRPSLYGNKVAFRGSNSNGQQGIYTGGIGELLSVVADASTPIPGGTGHFSNFGDAALSGNLVAFSGSDSNNRVGVYVDRENVKQNPMLKVIGTSDMLDGKSITELSFGHEGLSGNKLAFVANFSDASSGIYKAEIATTKDQCKNNGWKAFGFKNQGQCIQFVDKHDHGNK